MNSRAQTMNDTKHDRIGLEIAIIGMAGRFPGALDKEQFWENIKNNVESVSFFSDEELAAAGYDPQALQPGFVRAYGVIEDSEYFDEAFFHYTPGEAGIMDPQMRLLHECAWQALEDAGCTPDPGRRSIGLYAGAAPNFNWEAMTMLTRRETDAGGWFSKIILNNKDFSSTHISYVLDLNGPSLMIHTACSTSLAAVDLACRSILTGQCDIALAGGVTVCFPAKKGYVYQEGMIFSPDGHCRSFDARANGSVFGEGVGVVALKLLEDAVNDRDHIYAVIKGTAANNDGNRRVGYTAPGVQGQAEVIRAAQRMAGIDPETIDYIEAHGTATALGDTIEIKALAKAFKTKKRGYCALGTLKANVGHLDAAAGAAGLIKTTLALVHKAIPPSLHFETANPGIDFAATPFYVNTSLKEWESSGHPRRAGISSFGIGGTNAHVVVEEWFDDSSSGAGRGDAEAVQDSFPEVSATVNCRPFPQTKELRREYELIVLSAETAPALDRAAKNLAAYSSKNPGVDLADAAYTLAVGRKAFKYRLKSVCASTAEAIEILSGLLPGRPGEFCVKGESRSVVFLFPGQGAQYVNMGVGLYQAEVVFREEVDRCSAIVNPLLGYDISRIMYPEQADAAAERNFNQVDNIFPVLFIFEYALARLLMSWGIAPDLMIGYSFGEYTAACLAGVFQLEDALRLIVLRSRLLSRITPGAMLSAPLSEQELKPLLDETLSLAIVNGPSCVVSGTVESIADFEKLLKKKGYLSMRVNAGHALHSHLVEPILEEYAESVRGIKLASPRLPFYSCLSGAAITDQEARDPNYWVRHLRQTVHFSACIEAILQEKSVVLVEVGPGRDLAALVERYVRREADQYMINTIRGAQQKIPDVKYLLSRLGELWRMGIKIDWQSFYKHENRKKVSLPPYSFEKSKYPAVSDYSKLQSAWQPALAGSRQTGMAVWFYEPTWKRSRLLSEDSCSSKDGILAFAAEDGPAADLLERLMPTSWFIIKVVAGESFQELDALSYTISPYREEDYRKLFRLLVDRKQVPSRIIHTWNLGNDSSGALSKEKVEAAQEIGFYSLLRIARAVGDYLPGSRIALDVIGSHIFGVDRCADLAPEKATLIGAVKTIPREYPNIVCRLLDVDLTDDKRAGRNPLLSRLCDEINHKTVEQIIAYRGDYRWVQVYEPVQFARPVERPSRFSTRGVYLITGGLGGIGLVLAEYLARQFQAKLVLTGRREFPPRSEWPARLEKNNPVDKICETIKKLQELETEGAEIFYFQANAADRLAVENGIRQAESIFGRINGIIHAAGIADYSGVIQKRIQAQSEAVLVPKVAGTMALYEIFAGKELDFFILCSSISSIIAPFGQVAYSAANAFLDAFAEYNRAMMNHTFTVSISWDTWQQVGMALEAQARAGNIPAERNHYGILPAEGVEALRCILEHDSPHIIVSKQDLTILLHHLEELEKGLVDSPAAAVAAAALHPRPELTAVYAAPSTLTEKVLVEMWQRFFGIDKIGVQDDFFELGGDSLKAAILAAKISRRMSVEIPIAGFFKYPTIAQLADYIKNAAWGKFAPITAAEKREYYPLSSAQKRLYILQQMAPGSSVYNFDPLVLPLAKSIPLDRLQEIFSKLIARHDIFRASFKMIDEAIIQQIHDRVEFTVEYFEISSQELTETFHAFFSPFDLAQAPLLRAASIKAGDSYMFVSQMHHIITDAFSSEILRQEFLRFYNNGEDEMPDLRVQYRDYVIWFHSPALQPLLAQQERYWLDRFQDEILPLRLPTDFPRPPLLGFIGNNLSIGLKDIDIEKLKNLAKEEDITLFMLLLAIVYVFFARLSGQEDIIIGTPASGRRDADLERVLGLFVNTMPLRNYPAGHKPFTQFAQEVKESTLSAFENQDYPFEKLVEKVWRNRDSSRSAIFDVMFLQDMLPGNALAALAEAQEESYKMYSECDIVIKMVIGNGLAVNFFYKEELFKEATIRKFIDYFREIVLAVLKDKEIKLKDIGIPVDFFDGKLTLPQDEGDFEFR